MFRGEKSIIFIIVVIFGIAGFLYSANASTTNGTIDSTNKYVWSSEIGWINFGATNGGVTVTDLSLNGYAWSEQFGWINLAPTNSGVTNDSEGNLSGYAWSEQLGWINFSGVVINSSGKFTGTASGDNVGTINFDCTNCNVSTDWRPASSRTTSNNASAGGGGSVFSSPPSTYYFNINNNDSETNFLSVDLYLKGDGNTYYVWISEKSDLVPAERVTYQTGIDGQMIYSYNLSVGEGTKTVYVKFCNSQGYCGNIISDSIIYKIKQSSIETVVTSSPARLIDQVIPSEQTASDLINSDSSIGQKVVDTIKQIASKINLSIPDFLRSWKDVEEEKLEDVRKYVSSETPLSMSGKWELLPKDPIKQYVFAPLPNEFRALAKNISSIGNLFDVGGIDRMQDLRKLVGVKISIPSLGSSVGLISNQTGGLPLEKISDDLKNKIPTDMVFVRSGNQLVDFSTVLSLSVNGQPVQKLKTISGQKLYLSVKPEFSAKSVKGYLTFVSRRNEIGYNKSNGWWSKLGLVETVLAEETMSLDDIEKKMVLTQFDYTDQDGDGIYTAEVYSPVQSGQYEVLTVIEYQDSKFGTKLVRLVTVVDPEGYVYEKIKEKELRISSALVSLYWLNPQTKKYELWSASDYQQQNGQVTDAQGTYSFLVPPGTYYLQAQSAGYKDYRSAIFKVFEGEGVHMNIELKSESWWKVIYDYKTWIIILLSVLLLYMIEREIKGKRILKKI